ncbi:hypothetical protein ACJ73_02617, partial [Blastomyces percursus]
MHATNFKNEIDKGRQSKAGWLSGETVDGDRCETTEERVKRCRGRAEDQMEASQVGFGQSIMAAKNFQLVRRNEGTKERTGGRIRPPFHSRTGQGGGWGPAWARKKWEGAQEQESGKREERKDAE